MPKPIHMHKHAVTQICVTTELLSAGKHKWEGEHETSELLCNSWPTLPHKFTS